MGKLKNSKAVETKTMSRGPKKNVSVDRNEESSGKIAMKHAGHVMSTAAALHSKDPGFGQHKR